MAKSCPTIISLFCLFTLSVAAHAPSDQDELSTLVSLPYPNEPVSSEKQFNSIVSSVPLTKIPLRTVNRRFAVRSKHPCRHHHKVHPTMKENEEIPYGNDVIFSAGENSDFEEPLGGGPVWWLRHHHHHHHLHGEDSNNDNDEDEDRIEKIAFKRYDYNRFAREKEMKVLKKLRKHIRLQKVEDEKKGGFMRRVRKFLGQYF